MIETYIARLDEVIGAEIGPNATRTDVEGRYPQENLAALREAGLLGLLSATAVGGEGLGPRAATDVVERIAEHCSSTAMIICMHYAATAVIEAYGDDEVRRSIAAGDHVSTLAFSERGSRSHFWAPVSSAQPDGDQVRLDAHKSWVTGAGHAQSYVWSSQSMAGEGPSSLWLVPSATEGLKIDAPFDGLGLRGNESSPVSATGALIPASNALGPDGGGFDVMMGTVLPWFNTMNAAMSIGVMNAAVTRSAGHLSSSRLEHLDQSLADNPINRLHLAHAKVRAEQASALLDRAVTAIETGSDGAMLQVLMIKAAAGDAANEVLDICMRVCGGSAFRKEVGVERLFRDARAAAVMAPTSDALYDFIGKALCDLPLF